MISDEPISVDPDVVALVDGLHGQPGTRVPHVWVDQGGRRVSTLDLLGPGLTLFTGDHDAAWSDAVAAASKALGVPTRLQRLGADADLDGAWAAASESQLAYVLAKVLGRTR